MDPNACLAALLLNLTHAHEAGEQGNHIASAGHAKEACDTMLDMIGWLTRGGFAPDVQASIEAWEESLP